MSEGINLITAREAGTIVGFSKSTVQNRLMKREDFPKPVRLAPNVLRFVKSEVEAWAAQQVASRDAGQAA